jgi:hypothetical protein
VSVGFDEFTDRHRNTLFHSMKSKR